MGRNHIVLESKDTLCLTDIICGDKKILITYEEIEAQLPEYLRSEAMVSLLQKIVLTNFNVLTSGTGKTIVLPPLSPSPISISAKAKGVLLTKVLDTGIEKRAVNVLHNMCGQYVFSAVIFTDEELFKFRNFGQRCLYRFNSFLEEHEITAKIREHLNEKWSEFTTHRASAFDSKLFEGIKKVLPDVDFATWTLLESLSLRHRNPYIKKLSHQENSILLREEELRLETGNRALALYEQSMISYIASL